MIIHEPFQILSDDLGNTLVATVLDQEGVGVESARNRLGSLSYNPKVIPETAEIETTLDRLVETGAVQRNSPQTRAPPQYSISDERYIHAAFLLELWALHHASSIRSLLTHTDGPVAVKRRLDVLHAMSSYTSKAQIKRETKLSEQRITAEIDALAHIGLVREPKKAGEFSPFKMKIKKDLSKYFISKSNASMREIFRLLKEKDSFYSGEIVSVHRAKSLNMLEEAGLLTRSGDGNRRFYTAQYRDVENPKEDLRDRMIHLELKRKKAGTRFGVDLKLFEMRRRFPVGKEIRFRELYPLFDSTPESVTYLTRQLEKGRYVSRRPIKSETKYGLTLFGANFFETCLEPISMGFSDIPEYLGLQRSKEESFEPAEQTRMIVTHALQEHAKLPRPHYR